MAEPAAPISVLDLCSSWVSHYPADFPEKMSRIAATGMVKGELEEEKKETKKKTNSKTEQNGSIAPRLPPGQVEGYSLSLNNRSPPIGNRGTHQSV